MKYPNINALVPNGEHFDESAMNGEGIWLTPTHVDSIEASLAQNAEAVANVAASNTDLQTKVSELESQLQSSAAAYQDAQAELGHKDAEIEKLNAQITELKNSAAGSFSTTKKDEDESKSAPDPKEKYMQSSVTKAAMKYSKS